MALVAHYLSGSSRCYRRVVEEIRSTFDSVDSIQLGQKLNSCVFLQACVNEAMRLSPPGGSSLWREVETGGLSIEGDFIPAGCEVGVCVYAIHHHPDYWEYPFNYYPERWLNDREKAKGSDGPRRPFVPFNIGSRSCVGKPLAWAEIMLTYARLCWEFDFKRATSNLDNEVPDVADDVTFAEYVLKEHVMGQTDGPVLSFRARINEPR
jgi:cytochrome P450